MTESHTFRSPCNHIHCEGFSECQYHPEDEAHKLVKFARMINAQEKELQESQIETLLNVFVDGCCGKSDRLVMYALVKGLLERAFLYAQINNAKTQSDIEKETQRMVHGVNFSDLQDQLDLDENLKRLGLRETTQETSHGDDSQTRD